MKLTAEKLKQMITESLNERFEESVVRIYPDRIDGAFGVIMSGQYPHYNMAMQAAYGNKEMEQMLKDEHGITDPIDYQFYDENAKPIPKPTGYQDPTATPIRGME